MFCVQVRRFCWYFARSHPSRCWPDPRAFSEPFANQANIARTTVARDDGASPRKALAKARVLIRGPGIMPAKKFTGSKGPAAFRIRPRRPGAVAVKVEARR